MLARRDLVEVPNIETRVARSVQLQNALHLLDGDASHPRHPPSAIKQPRAPGVHMGLTLVLILSVAALTGWLWLLTQATHLAFVYAGWSR